MARQAPALISVALCTHNGAAYLAEQLASVLAQRQVEIEIVAVDDASSDDSAAILRGHAASDARIRCYSNQANLGPTASFQHAMSLCRGAFIAPCDQDDLWLPDKLARLQQAIGDCDLAYCDSALIDADGQPLGRRVSDDRRMHEGIDPIALLFENSVSGHAALLRRDLYQALAPFPHGVFHDWWLALCAAGRNGVRYLDEPLVRFRRHHGAFSRIGNRGAAQPKAEASRAWLQQRLALIDAYAGTGLRDAGFASRLSEALHAALDDGRHASLLRLLWRQRKALPGGGRMGGLGALPLQSTLLRKVMRARS